MTLQRTTGTSMLSGGSSLTAFGRPFCRTGLPLARTRWVGLTFSSNCPLSSNQRRWLTPSTTIIFPLKFLGECCELNPGLLSEMQVFNLCAMQPSKIQAILSNCRFERQWLWHSWQSDPFPPQRSAVRTSQNLLTIGLMRQFHGKDKSKERSLFKEFVKVLM